MTRRELVLRELKRAAAPVGIAELADRLGVHPNTVRFHLDKLVGDGRVERVSARVGAMGRPAQLYQAVRGMDPSGPREFELLARVLVEALSARADPSAEAARAGRQWGRARALADGPQAARHTPLDRLERLMDELGFAPELSGAPHHPRDHPQNHARDHAPHHPRNHAPADLPEQPTVSWLGLRSCPFLELATDRPAVVCPVHLGLMQGALEGWGADVTVPRLDPFVQPDLCLAHLAPVSA